MNPTARSHSVAVSACQNALRAKPRDTASVARSIGLAPKMAVSDVVRIFKTNTARGMVREFPYLEKVYWDGGSGIWSAGYFVSTVGVNEAIIRKYIEQQGKEDSGQANLDMR